MNFLELTDGALSHAPSSIGILNIVVLVCVLGFTGAPLCMMVRAWFRTENPTHTILDLAWIPARK